MSRRKTRLHRSVALSLFLSALWLVLTGAGCSGKVIPQGGLMLVVRTDGTLSQATRLHLEVTPTNGGAAYRSTDYAIPAEVTLPTTLGIATNGSPTASVAINASLWAGTTLLDDRVNQVLQIPTDRVAELDIVFSAKCTALARVVDGAGASSCATGQTCDPATGGCASSTIQAGTLPTYGGEAGADAGAEVASVDASDGNASCTGDPVYVDNPNLTADNHCAAGGASVDLMTDGANCGACGHGCASSTCSAGACAPTKLLPQANVVAAYVAGGTVYYVDEIQQVATAGLGDASGKASPFRLLSGGVVRRLQIDATFLWVSTTVTQMRIQRADGITEPIPTQSTDISGVVALTNDHYYYGVAGGVEQHTKDGALVLIAPSAAVTDVVADAKGAFWATKEATGARLHGPFPSVASLGTPASAVALALDADYLYFADTSAQQIRRAPRLPGNTQALAKESTPTIGSLAVDGNYVYWTADHGAPDGWALMRVSKCGGIPLTLGKGFARLTQLSFDDTYVYTAIVKSPTGSSLIRIAK